MWRGRRHGVEILAVVALLALWHPAAAQTFQALEGFELVDADGTVVSVFYPSPRSAIGLASGSIAFRLDRTIFWLSFSSGRLGGNEFLYETLDCSSPPHVDATQDRVTISVGPPGHTLYLPDRSVPAVQRTILARTVGPRCQPFRNPKTELVIPPKPIFNLETRFTPPFRIRPRVVQEP